MTGANILTPDNNNDGFDFIWVLYMDSQKLQEIIVGKIGVKIINRAGILL